MLPLETVLAVFPETSRQGGCTGPLTLAHVVAMEAIGVEVGVDAQGEKAFLAAWLLTLRPGELGGVVADGEKARASFAKWAETHDADEAETARRVNAVVDAALLPYVRGGGGSTACVSAGPQGYGWPLEYAEMLCHEYGMKFEDALATPLATAFGLAACARARNGGKAGGPDYYERIALKAIRKAAGHGG